MDSGSVNDFFRQIPTVLIVMFCGSGVLLVVALGYIFRERGKRGRAIPAAVNENDMPSAAAYDESSGDLPDLDVLASAEVVQAAAPPRPAGTYSLNLSEGDTVEVVEVLTVVRDVGDGGLIIRIGDKAYRNPPAVADAEFKRRFHGTLRDLSEAKRTIEPEPVVAAESVVGDAAVLEAPPVVPVSAPLPEVPRLSPHEPAPGDLPKFKMPEGPPVKPKRGQRPVAEPIPEINIAGSIEAFLQHKLSMTPQFANRSIHVRPALHGGVQIEVDGVFYESVSEVADDSVRQFLAATIEEWQARQ